MTLAMDLRLASTKARIGFVFGRLGIVPEAASTWFLPRIVGVQQALEWIYSAEILTAEQALAGPAGQLGARARRPAARRPGHWRGTFVVGRSPVALALARQLVYRNSAVAASARRPPGGLAGDVLHVHRRRPEGVAAFREKREPRFTGKASELPEIFPSRRD